MGDVKEAIKKVLTKVYSKSDLKKIGMDDGGPESSFKLIYDSQVNQLEPIYYWLLDFMQDMGINPIEKITDNFMASPGSGQFAEMGQRVTRMQEEGMKMLGALNQVIKSVLNLLYDLKEFELRLHQYDDAKSKDPKLREAGNLALKQIWLDNVDLKRGKGSIHQMSSMEMGFTVLREAFLIANTVDDVKKMAKEDGLLNEQVMRVLIPRVDEFVKWKDYSEKELRKRFRIEKAYLNSQVETIKLYSSWVGPYLKAAEQLRQKGFEKSPALVNAFSTTMFDLVLLGKRKINFEKAVKSNKLPGSWENYKLKRDYYSCFIISFIFRGHVSQRITQKGDQGFGMGGRVDIKFDSYILNEQELQLVQKELSVQDIEDGLKFVGQGAEESLESLKEDISHFLDEDTEEKKKEEKNEDNTNPFSALWDLFKKSDEKKKDKVKIESAKDVKKDNFVEKAVRELGAADAKGTLYAIYDVYKKAHGMASSPDKFDNGEDLSHK